MTSETCTAYNREKAPLFTPHHSSLPTKAFPTRQRTQPKHENAPAAPEAWKPPKTQETDRGRSVSRVGVIVPPELKSDARDPMKGDDQALSSGPNEPPVLNRLGYANSRLRAAYESARSPAPIASPVIATDPSVPRRCHFSYSNIFTMCYSKLEWGLNNLRTLFKHSCCRWRWLSRSSGIGPRAFAIMMLSSSDQ